MFFFRFERAPMAEPEVFWSMVPSKRSDTFRHIPLEHSGCQNEIHDAAIIRAHDRTAPLRYRYSTNN